MMETAVTSRSDSPTAEQQVDLDQMEVFIASELEPDQYQRVKPMIAEIRRLRRLLDNAINELTVRALNG